MTGLNPNQGPDVFDQALRGLTRLSDRGLLPLSIGEDDQEEPETPESEATPQASPPENLSLPSDSEPPAALPPQP